MTDRESKTTKNQETTQSELAMPHRIQRKRTKGWRMPEGAVYVGRPTKWGNPYPWQSMRNLYCSEIEMRQEAVDMYRDWRSDSPDWINEVKTELRGKSLACFCPLDQPCHADVLLKISNRGSDA